jgi:radical SAM superfamily enzyme YgiQ (UPF0313 family)
MAKVALVNPHIITTSFAAKLKNISSVSIRRSLALLSSCLKEKGHDVILLDLRMLKSWEDYRDKLVDARPDFVGATSLTSDHALAIKCLEIAKETNKSVVTVAGGIHPTMFPEQFTETGVVDHVLRGEGEVSLPKLVESRSKFPEVFWGETPDLDTIPFEDRKLWPDYEKRIRFSWWNLPPPLIDMLTHRGCPWKCKFCCGPGEQNLYSMPREDGSRVFKLRAKSVKRVMEELVQLYDQYRFRSLIFSDDEFLIRPDWVHQFCQAMKDYGFVQKGVRWWAAARADMICRFESLVKEMKDAGLYMVSIGFESFSDRMLAWMNKGTTSQQNWDAARICKNLNLKIFGNFMFGMPYSDGKWYPEDDIITYEAIKKMKPEVCALSYFKPIPGSALYDWCVENNLLKDSAYSTLATEGIDVLKGVDYALLEKLSAKLRPRFRGLYATFKRRIIQVIENL